MDPITKPPRALWRSLPKQKPLPTFLAPIDQQKPKLMDGSTLSLDRVQLPKKRNSRYLRHARYTFLNVYRRLFSLVFILNMLGLAVLLSRNSRWHLSPPPLTDFATATSANVMIAILIRQDYIINACFKLAWSVPLSAPLRLRCILAKVYAYGGVHSGAAFCALIWFCLLTGL